MKLNILYFAILSLFFWQCASQQAITGGDRDETPPKLIRSLPTDQSLNYKGNIIVLEFDETIITKNLRKELIIAPYTKVKYTNRIKKGRVFELKLDSALDENTTYTFNFRNSIQDFNEKNPAENLKVAFSTGDYIDSLYVEGNVEDLLTGSNVKNASIILYASDDTLGLSGGIPIYVGKSDEEGDFKIENIKPDSYQIVALSEADDNLKYTKREEKIAFLKEDIQLDSSITGLSLKVMDYDFKEFKLISARQNKQYFDFKFNKTVRSFELDIADSIFSESVLAKNLGEEIRLFNPALVATDSFEITLTATDSIGNQLDTTRFIQFSVPKKMAEEKFSVETSPANNSKFARNDSLQIEFVFNKPVTEIRLDSIYQIFQVNDSTMDTVNWNMEPIAENYRTKIIFPKTQITEKLSYQFRKGAFISADSDTLDAQNITYSIMNPEDYGVLSGKIETWADNFVIQLLDNGKVEQEIRDEKNYTFRFVKPGKKSIRILVDENGNGKWDSGDYKTKILPEKVYFYNGSELNLKANWEIEADLIEF
ncbi:MAG: hypothetical protein ACI85I_000525 [Arenicella sp.]